MIDAPASPATSGRPRPKEDRELKKRISLSVLPSLYDDIQKIAYVQRRSTSELVALIMDEYRSKHEDDLAEYERLKKVIENAKSNRRLPKCKPQVVYI